MTPAQEGLKKMQEYDYSQGDASSLSQAQEAGRAYACEVHLCKALAAKRLQDIDLRDPSLNTAVQQPFKAKAQYRELGQQLVQLRQQDDGLKTEQGEKKIWQWTKVQDQGLFLPDQVTMLCLSPGDSAEIKAVLSRQGSEITTSSLLSMHSTRR